MAPAWYALPSGLLGCRDDDGATAGADAGEPERQVRAQRTRRGLLLAAARCLSERGYHATTLRDVLETAGVTKGALYFHFSSKLELARELTCEASRTWLAALADIDERGLDPLQVLLVQTDAALVRWNHDVVFRGALRAISDAPELAEVRRRWYSGWEARTQALLTAALDQGLLVPGTDTADLTRGVLALVAGHQALCEVTSTTEECHIRMSTSWERLFESAATAGWLAEWRASGWHTRELPDGAALAEEDLAPASS